MRARAVSTLFGSTLFGVVLLLAGCGIPEDAHPAVVPGGVVSPALGPATTTIPSPAPTVEATVFLVRGDQLTPVLRRTSRLGVIGALQELLDGPTEPEVASGLRTAITIENGLRLVRTDGETAIIDLPGTFVGVGGQEQILAVGQVVLTATAVSGVTDVRFALEGQPVEVPRADGTLSAGPLTAADYDALRQP